MRGRILTAAATKGFDSVALVLQRRAVELTADPAVRQALWSVELAPRTAIGYSILRPLRVTDKRPETPRPSVMSRGEHSTQPPAIPTLAGLA